MRSKNEVFVGIDVGKDTLVVNSGRDWQVSNSQKGVKKLIEALQKMTPTLVVMESTGGYEQLLLNELWKGEIPVCRINPRRSKAFADSLGINAKTDSIDAGMLRRFAEKVRPIATPAPSLAVRKIKPLIDRRVQLVEMITQEKNHLKAPLIEELTKKSIKRIIEVLKVELKELDALILHTISSFEELRNKASILQQQVGVGPVLTMMLLADLPELGTISREKVGSLVGVAPLNNQSGLFNGRRSIRGGRKQVRSVLYMATVAAIRHNQQLKTFFLSLVKRGKHKMVALVATMRRMLVVLNASMRNFLETQHLITSGA